LAGQSKDAQAYAEGTGFPESMTPQARTWLQELPSGIAQARLNLADPLWKLKVQQQGLALKHTQLQIDDLHQKIQEQAQQFEWQAQDAKTHDAYLIARQQNPNLAQPGYKSDKWQKISDTETMNTIRQQNADTTLLNAKNRADFEALKAGMTRWKLDETVREHTAREEERQREEQRRVAAEKEKERHDKELEKDRSSKPTQQDIDAHKILGEIRDLDAKIKGAEAVQDEEKAKNLRGERDARLEQYREMTGVNLGPAAAATAPAAAAQKGKPRVLSITPAGQEPPLIKPGQVAYTGPMREPDFIASIKNAVGQGAAHHVRTVALKAFARRVASKMDITDEDPVYNAITEGSYKGITNDQIKKFVAGLSEEERTELYAGALKDAGVTPMQAPPTATSAAPAERSAPSPSLRFGGELMPY
jgi:hypothetical protein